jgi:hypothetical protein
VSELRSLDLTGAVAPALSTTSDMPQVADPKFESPKGAVSDEEIKAGGTEALRNRQREADARTAQLDERLGRALSAVERLTTHTDTQVRTEPADPRPVRRAYDDPDTYEADLVTWSAKAAAKVTKTEIENQAKEREASHARQKEQAQFRERVDAWGKAKTIAVEKYPDFVEVVESPDLRITPAMAFAILEENLEGGKGYEISYYLGKHPQEAAKIAALPQARQALAIGRLAERIEAQRTKPTSSRTTVGRKSPAEESMDEYARRRNAELRAR